MEECENKIIEKDKYITELKKENRNLRNIIENLAKDLEFIKINLQTGKLIKIIKNKRLTRKNLEIFGE